MPPATANRPARNTIGGEPPALPDSMLARVEFAKSSRAIDPEMSVRNPETGEVLTLSRPNARDYINHLGWEEVTAAAETAEEDDDEVESPGVLADRSTNGKAASEIDMLRDRIRATGALVDLRWGLNRLREQVAEIEKAEAAKAAATGGEDDE